MNLKQAKKELEQVKQEKRKLINRVWDIKNEFESGKLRYTQYTKELNTVLKGQSFKLWLKYYDTKIDQYQTHIKKNTPKIISDPYLITAAVLLLLITSIFLLFNSGYNSITGFVTIEEPESPPQYL